jgi:hypothetical protein
MMRKFFLLLLLTTALAPLGAEEKCVQIRGRAISWRGNAFFSIWHVGTNHRYFVVDEASQDLVCKYFDCESPSRQPALFADFTLCPTEPFKQEAAQPAIVKGVAHPRVVAIWPPPNTPREFVDEFYKWYGQRMARDIPDKNTLKLMHWDLSPEVWKLLDKDRETQSSCREIVGLDFDPIVGSQEPSDSYKAGEITQQGLRYRASIYGTTNGQRATKPEVVAEFVHQGDRWIFLNFFYPSAKTDLLTLLRPPRPKCTVPKALTAK